MITMRSIILRITVCLVVALLCFLSGCSGYALRPDFEQCKERMTSIAIVPPVVYYSSYDHPLFSIKGWESGGRDERYDPYLSEATQKNIEEVARGIVSTSKYTMKNCKWPVDQDVMCVPNMERLREAAPDVLDEISRDGKRALTFSMGADCATVGRCTGATHLLFIMADGFSTRKLFENYGREKFWDIALGGQETDPITGLPLASCKLGIQVMLVEASSGSVVYWGRRGEREVPGSHIKGIRGILSDQLKPVLGK